MKFLLWMAAPLCKNCVHYKPYKYSSFESISGECDKASTVNLVTGEETYSYASEVRRKECGTEGRLYEPEPNLLVKKTLHNGLVNLPYIMMGITYSIVFYVVTRI
jgi:hypothetical protein